MSCDPYKRSIDLLVLGEKLGDRSQPLFDHLRTCSSCARHYNHVAWVTRQMGPDTSGCSPEELAAIGDAVLRTHAAKAPTGTLPRLLAAVGFGAVAVLALLVIAPLADSSSDDSVQARGSSPVVDADLRAYCLGQQEGNFQVVGASDPLRGHLSCGVGEALQFAYRLRSPDDAWLYVVGIDAAGRLLDYQPRPPQHRSVPIHRGDGEQILPGSIRLAVNHEPGTVRVLGLVSPQALSHEDVTRAVDAMDGGAAAPGIQTLTLSLEVLP